jgi:putative copper resistance protein D
MLEASLIVSRFLHYTATLTLFGLSLFPLYTYTELTAAPYMRLTTIRLTALAALLSAVFWFMSVAFSMAGTLDGDAVWSVLSETSFGKVWMARFILVTIILVLATPQLKSPTERMSWLFPALCAGLLVSLAGVGHAQTDNGIAHAIHMSADGLHLLAAGAWLGGLVSLFSLVARAVRSSPLDCDAEATNAAMRFSGMGYIAVATLIGSGLINSWFLVGSFTNLGTPYGQLLIAKLVLFTGMLGLAGLNRFLIVPSLIKGNNGGHVAGLMRLCRHICGEQALGVVIIFIVSALGTMQPAIN